MMQTRYTVRPLSSPMHASHASRTSRTLASRCGIASVVSTIISPPLPLPGPAPTPAPDTMTLRVRSRRDEAVAETELSMPRSRSSIELRDGGEPADSARSASQSSSDSLDDDGRRGDDGEGGPSGGADACKADEPAARSGVRGRLEGSETERRPSEGADEARGCAGESMGMLPTDAASSSVALDRRRRRNSRMPKTPPRLTRRAAAGGSDLAAGELGVDGERVCETPRGTPLMRLIVDRAGSSRGRGGRGAGGAREGSEAPFIVGARTPRSISRCRTATLASVSIDEALGRRRRRRATDPFLPSAPAAAAVVSVSVSDSDGRARTERTRGGVTSGASETQRSRLLASVPGDALSLVGLPSPRSMSVCACSHHAE